MKGNQKMIGNLTDNRLKKILVSLSLFLGGSIMGGCSNYSNSFDCPYGRGAGCASISRVNTMIDNHELGFDEKESLNKMKNIHIFYGPERLGKIITVQEPLAS